MTQDQGNGEAQITRPVSLKPSTSHKWEHSPVDKDRKPNNVSPSTDTEVHQKVPAVEKATTTCVAPEELCPAKRRKPAGSHPSVSPLPLHPSAKPSSRKLCFAPSWDSDPL